MRISPTPITRPPAKARPLLGVSVAALALTAAWAAGALGTSARAASPTAPSCVPPQLNQSAVLSGANLYVSPQPDSRDAGPSTQISLLGAPVAALSAVTVSGSSSGTHTGRLIGYSQGDGASFVPTKAFTPGETVTVHGRVLRGSSRDSFAFRFVVSAPNPVAANGSVARSSALVGDVQRFRSRPDLEPPAVRVTTFETGLAPGYIFAAPYSGPGQHGPLIFDTSGQIVWFDPLPANVYATNLQVQQYNGQQLLTWWQGNIPPQGFGEGEEIIANSAYQQVAAVHAGNGYQADLHDFQITPQGTALLTVFNPIHCNLSAVGGPQNGSVTDGVFQEIDLKTGLVRREWHSLDHVALSQSYSSAHRSTLSFPFDYFHINSLDIEQGGSLLISARNTWALYVLNPATGQVVTQIGGRHPSLAMQTGSATAWQHDATQLPDGTISIFDNGAVPKIHSFSRGLVIRLNPSGGASVVRQYVHPGAVLLSGSQGNMQTLTNGNVFVGWGAEPYFSEFNAAGQMLFDAHMPRGDESYRGYTFNWVGTPKVPPAIAAVRSSKGNVTVWASWNGATGVAAWRVLTGTSPKHLEPVGGSARTGFETAITTTSPGPYAEAEALAADGTVLGTSAVGKD